MTRSATVRILWGSATLEPPYFWTTTGMAAVSPVRRAGQDELPHQGRPNTTCFPLQSFFRSGIQAFVMHAEFRRIPPRAGRLFRGECNAGGARSAAGDRRARQL